MNLDRLRLFYYAAKARSFTHTELNMSSSALSRQISTLEHELKVQVFHRYPRHLELTDKGQILFEVVRKILVDLETMENRLGDMDEEPSGTLKVMSPAGWGSNLMLQFIPYYLKKYPKIRLNIKSIDGIPNFREGDVDIAIFPFIPDNANLKHKHLQKFRIKLYASPEYIEEYGLPETPKDLDHHRLISYDPDFYPFKFLDWHLSLGKGVDEDPREAYLIVNNLYSAVSQGLGIASLMVENPYRMQSNLVNILPDYEGQSMDIYCIYPEHLEHSTRVTSFVNTLKEKANQLFDSMEIEGE